MAVDCLTHGLGNVHSIGLGNSLELGGLLLWKAHRDRDNVSPEAGDDQRLASQRHMAIRLLATYEFIDKDGHAAGTVRLPVVGYASPDSEGRERPRVLLLSGDDPYLVDFHPDSTLETKYGKLEALLIDAVADPIPAQPGWVAELWVQRAREEPELLGVYPVLAWEPEPNASFDDAPQGHAVLLIPDRDERLDSHSGPISTRDLPGAARYRRDDAPPFQAPEF